ncbi:MAG TPA: helix-turn-helix domain-containing protein [Arsenophonus apicola]|uniref:helix-turn-helix domain-containing protein n=1 Tax=Arsenophonus TaxID=637 RepID=UPI00192D57EA|nr:MULTISPECIES: helix-turn-helix transcriptional regulator [Arsenophonus]UBX30028.1 helix-turn-helix transcriptional regulator [Arsenophonus apicola]
MNKSSAKKMNINEEEFSRLPFSQKITILRAYKSLTQAQLASLVGVSQRQIAAYESGNAKPRGNTLLKLGSVLGKSPIQLMHPVDNVSRPRMNVSFMPVLKHNRIIDWLHYTMDPTGKSDDLLDECVEREIKTIQSSGSFALEIDEPAMSTVGSNGICFPKKAIVIFDISKCNVLMDGDFVLAVINHKHTMFRQFFYGLKESSLAPFDQRYPIEKIATNTIPKTNLLIPAVHIDISLPAMNRSSKLII